MHPTAPLSRRALLAHLSLLGAGALAGGAARAQAWPAKPIRIVVPWAAGGGGDVLVRAITADLAQRLGQPIVVDNRPGAIGSIGSQAVARSPADGYTLLYGTADSHSIAPHVLKTAPYDARKEFVAIAPIGFTPLTLVVPAAHPARSFAHFLQLAREAREPLTYGSWGQGSSGQITVESLKQKARVELLHIPYAGTAPLMQAVLGQQVQCAIQPVLVAEPHVRTGAVRMLAVTARERLAGHPEVPLMKEVGVEIDMGPWLGFLGPAGLPAEIVNRLNSAISASIAEPAVAESLRKMAMVVERMSPAAYQQFYLAEYERWGQTIRSARIVLEG